LLGGIVDQDYITEVLTQAAVEKEVVEGIVVTIEAIIMEVVLHLVFLEYYSRYLLTQTDPGENAEKGGNYL